jgi:hypothetical protein
MPTTVDYGVQKGFESGGLVFCLLSGLVIVSASYYSSDALVPALDVRACSAQRRMSGATSQHRSQRATARNVQRTAPTMPFAASMQLQPDARRIHTTRRNMQHQRQQQASRNTLQQRHYFVFPHRKRRLLRCAPRVDPIDRRSPSVPVQFLVTRSALRLHATTKACLPGTVAADLCQGPQAVYTRTHALHDADRHKP